MTQAHPSDPPPRPNDARTTRRVLLDGPAVRQALALAEKEPNHDSGWKLLEGPPKRSATAAATGQQRSQPAKASAGAASSLRKPSPKSTIAASPPAPAALSVPKAPLRQPSSPRVPPPPPLRRASPARMPAFTAPAENATAKPVAPVLIAPVPVMNVVAIEPAAPTLPVGPEPEAASPAVETPPSPPSNVEAPPSNVEAMPSNVEAMPSTVFRAEPSPHAALAESAPSPAGLTRQPARGIHIALVAMAGLGAGLALGLAVLPLASARPAPANAPVSVEQPRHTETVPLPEVTPTPTPAPAPAAKEAATASSGAVIPWDDSAQVKVPSCEELAAPSLRGASPKGFLLQGALKEAPRAMMRGDTPAAHLAFCLATQLGARTPAVLAGLSQTQLMLADADAALKTADQLVQLNPNVAAHLDLRGDVLIRLGRVEEAKSAWFSAAKASRPSDLLIRNLLRSSKSAAEAALRAGDLSRADRMLRRAIALEPKDAAPCLQLAGVLAKSGQQAAAERWKLYAQSLAR